MKEKKLEYFWKTFPEILLKMKPQISMGVTATFLKNKPNADQWSVMRNDFNFKQGFWHVLLKYSSLKIRML